MLRTQLKAEYSILKLVESAICVVIIKSRIDPIFIMTF